MRHSPTLDREPRVGGRGSGVSRERSSGASAVLGSWHQRATLALAAILIAYYVLSEWLAPLPYYSMKYDPEMPYFINSLALLKGVPYAFIDHPGTPVEVLGTVMLALTRPWTRSMGALFIPYHLENPQVFLAMAHGFLTVASVACLLLLARRAVEVGSRRGIVAASAVAVAFYAVHPEAAFQTLTTWSHNSFAFPAGTLLLLGLVARLRRKEAVTPGEGMLAGVLSGLLTAVQLYFFAWGAGVITALVVQAWLRREAWMAVGRKAAASLAGVGLGFFIGFAPVMHRFREFYLWVDRLVFHQGRFGFGPEGITTAGVWLDHLELLSRQTPWPFVASGIIVGAVLTAMWLRRRSLRDRAGWWAACLGLLVQLGLLWAVIGKHPGRVYLLAVAAVIPLLLALALEALIAEGGRWPFVATGLGALVLAAFAAGWVTSAMNHIRKVDHVARIERAIEQQVLAYAHRVGKDPEELDIVWAYGSPSRCYALRFGNLAAGIALEDEIDSVCDHEWVYEVWGRYAMIGGRNETLAGNTEWDVAIIPVRFRPPVAGRVGEILDTGIESEGYGNILIVTPLAKWPEEGLPDDGAE